MNKYEESLDRQIDYYRQKLERECEQFLQADDSPARQAAVIRFIEETLGEVEGLNFTVSITGTSVSIILNFEGGVPRENQL